MKNYTKIQPQQHTTKMANRNYGLGVQP